MWKKRWLIQKFIKIQTETKNTVRLKLKEILIRLKWKQKRV